MRIAEAQYLARFHPHLMNRFTPVPLDTPTLNYFFREVRIDYFLKMEMDEKRGKVFSTR